jgi:hypothetical protein
VKLELVMRGGAEFYQMGQTAATHGKRFCSNREKYTEQGTKLLRRMGNVTPYIICEISFWSRVNLNLLERDLGKEL